MGHSVSKLRTARLIPDGSIGGARTLSTPLGYDRAGQNRMGMGPVYEGLQCTQLSRAVVLTVRDSDLRRFSKIQSSGPRL